MLWKDRMKSLIDEGTLAWAWDTCNDYEFSEREGTVHVLKVIATSAVEKETPPLLLPRGGGIFR